MDVVSEYASFIRGNNSERKSFLENERPDLKELIRQSPAASGVSSKSKGRKSFVNESPSWFRIRPVRKRRKYDSDESDSDNEVENVNSPRQTEVESLEISERRFLGRNKRPNEYGPVEGTVIGQWWMTRLECSYAGVHRPTVAGIHSGPEGAYSVALSGGYEGDWDLGDEFIYTGEGGRDLKGTKSNPKNLRTAPQSKDQELTRGNLALQKSYENKSPVRVIRGFKLKSSFAPEEGYRYDGLYEVTKCWTCTGKSGFLLYKFHFSRIDNQLSLIDSMDNVLLFTSIKKMETPRRKSLRRRSSANRSVTLSRSSYDEDSDEESRNSDSNFGLSPDKREAITTDHEVLANLFYHDGSSSENMFYKGRFLGWENSEMEVEDTIAPFQETLRKLLEDFSPLSDDSSPSIIPPEIPDESSSHGNRRKLYIPRRIIRNSKP